MTPAEIIAVITPILLAGFCVALDALSRRKRG
jgi:hypothetical protein